MTEGPVWFRGQPAGFGGKLRPLLYRKRYDAIDDALDEEDLLRSEFIRLGMQLSSTTRNQWEWYFLMQHFGVPTRLLDWTDNALAALYFAVSSDPTGADHPVVFALDPHRLNAEVFRRSFRGKSKPSGVISPEWDVANEWLMPDLFRDSIVKRYPFSSRFAAYH